MESLKKYQFNREKLIKAFLKLENAIEQDYNEYVQDSVIQRFEFTFELLWKTLKFYLLVQGFEETTPRNILKKSFKIWLLEEIDIYIDMIDTRNLTSHTYDEILAGEVYDFIVKNCNKLKIIVEKLPEGL